MNEKIKCDFCEGTGKLCFDGQTTKCCVCDGEGEYECDCGFGSAKTCKNCDTFDCCDPDPAPNEPDIEATRE